MVLDLIACEPLTQALSLSLRGSSAPNPTSATDRTPNDDQLSRAKQTPPLPTHVLNSLATNPNHTPTNNTTMASRIPSALRSAALARPTIAHNSAAALRRSFQTSQRMQETVIAAAPVRKPVGAFRGT
jgi:hypothetical protein